MIEFIYPIWIKCKHKNPFLKPANITQFIITWQKSNTFKSPPKLASWLLCPRNNWDMNIVWKRWLVTRVIYMARRVWEKLCFEYTLVNLYSFIPKLVTKPEYLVLALSVWGLWGDSGKDKYKRHWSWLQSSKWASLIAQKVKNLPKM